MACPSHHPACGWWKRRKFQSGHGTSELPQANSCQRFASCETGSCKRALKGLSRMKRNFHVRFLGGMGQQWPVPTRHNAVPIGDGEFEGRGGFWSPVEIWHRDAKHWQSLYAKGMRVLVQGRMVHEEWEDTEGKPRQTFKVQAQRVGVLPYRIEAITLTQKPADTQQDE